MCFTLSHTHSVKSCECGPIYILFFFKENNDKGHVEFMFHVPSVAFVVCPMGHH